MSNSNPQKTVVQYAIPSHALVLQATEHLRFEGNDLEDIEQLVALWKKEVFPHTTDDIDPTLSKAEQKDPEHKRGPGRPKKATEGAE